MSTDLRLKYRPKDFSEVIGHERVCKSLEQVLKKGTSRAFVFTGPSGVGKTTLARIIASRVGCLGANLKEIDGAVHGGVEAMRGVGNELAYRPLQGSTKVVIVDEAHALSRAAWQSVLKVVEEPPDGCYWIFATTEAGRIPETIKTRCACYDLRPVDLNAIDNLLTRINKEEELMFSGDAIYEIAAGCEGSPRQALTALSQIPSNSSAKEVAEWMKRVGEEQDVVALCRAIAQRKDWQQIMRVLGPLLETDAESLRISIVRYIQVVTLKMTDMDKVGRGLEMLDCFTEPYRETNGHAELLVSIGRAIFEGGNHDA